MQALDQATARLAGLNRHDAGEVEQALAARLRAIEALTQWIAAEQQASQPVSSLVASHLMKNLATGAEILLRMVLDREATRTHLMLLGRKMQMLRGLARSHPAKPSTIDCQG